MTVVFMTDPATGKVALFDEASGGGDPADVNSQRNRPLKNPSGWLANIYFHTDLDNLEVAFDQTVSVSHAAVSSVTTTTFLTATGALAFNAYHTDRLLLTHNLGYIPDCMVAQGTNMLWPGFPVQTGSDGRGRYVSIYATTTEIRMYEWVSATATALPATTLSYRILVFANPPAPADGILIDFNPSSGLTYMAGGRFRSDRHYLQVTPGGSPFGLSAGKSIDLSNGAVRYVRPDGTRFEPIPSSLQLKLRSDSSGYGPSMAYNGSFAAETSILVQAP